MLLDNQSLWSRDLQRGWYYASWVLESADQGNLSYMQGVPNELVCFDEARELIKDEGCLLFRSFREALRKWFLRSSNPADPTKPQRDFFAVLLDTTFKVWDSPPPAHWDHNQKGLNEWGVKQRLFPQYTVSTQMIFITKARTLRSKMVLQRQLCSFSV